MTTEDFNKHLEQFLSHMTICLNQKAKEYAPYHDRLQNLKDISALTGITPERAAFILASKHITSVAVLLELHDQGHYTTLAVWDEKLIDIANYCVLIYAILSERFIPPPPVPCSQNEQDD